MKCRKLITKSISFAIVSLFFTSCNKNHEKIANKMLIKHNENECEVIVQDITEELAKEKYYKWNGTKCVLTVGDELESEIEKLRQILNNMPNFDLYQIFMNISSDNKISPYDLFSFYSKMNNNVINKSLFSNIIFFYDEDRDSCLSYSEFMSFILSDTNFNLRRCSHDKICCAEFESELPNDIREGIYNIIEKELEMIITIITSNKSIDYSKEEFFNEVKINECYYRYSCIPKMFKFIDGIPFGIKEE